QGTQSSRMQALLEAAQGSCGVTERACQIVLIRVSGFVQRNQGIGFGGAILPGVVGVDDAMDENDALVPFGLEGNAFIHEHHLRNRGEVGKEIAGIGSRVHDQIECLRVAGEKSGQVLVRTLESEKPSQMRLGRSSRTAISRRSRGRCERHSNGRLKKRTGFGPHPGERKAKPDAVGRSSRTAISRWSRGRCERHSGGRLKKRTGFGPHPGERKAKPDAVGRSSRTAISRWSRGGCERHSGGRLKKRTGFGPHPGERKAKPDAVGTQFTDGNFSLESREMRAAFRRAIEKADRFWSAPWRAKSQA